MKTSVRESADIVLNVIVAHLRSVLEKHPTQIDSSMRSRLSVSINGLVPGVDYDTIARVRSFVMDEECVAAAQGHNDLADSLDIAYGSLGTVLVILS